VATVSTEIWVLFVEKGEHLAPPPRSFVLSDMYQVGCQGHKN
jgi:hypothetical protein